MTVEQRRLTIAWAMLMGLSLAIAIAGDVRQSSRLAPLWLVTVGVVTTLKVKLILGDYLGLRHSRGALVAFTLAGALTLVLVIGAFIAVRR